MISIKGCKGCIMLRRLEKGKQNIVDCSILQVAVFTEREVTDCPCVDCLVKVMCEDECDEWVEYRSYYPDCDNIDAELENKITKVNVNRVIIEGDIIKYDTLQ